MLFLSEVCGVYRTAQVFHRRNQKDYVMIGFEGSFERHAHPFEIQTEAEDYAQQWVKLTS